MSIVTEDHSILSKVLGFDLYFFDGRSDKVYNVIVAEKSGGEHFVVARYGRRLSTLRDERKNEEALTLIGALELASSIVYKKLQRGYSFAKPDVSRKTQEKIAMLLRCRPTALGLPEKPLFRSSQELNEYVAALIALQGNENQVRASLTFSRKLDIFDHFLLAGKRTISNVLLTPGKLAVFPHVSSISFTSENLIRSIEKVELCE